MNLSPDAQGPAVSRVVRKYASELMQGVIVTIEPGRARVRLLPLV